MYNFIFREDKTNEIVIDGINYRIERYRFQPNYRVDLMENDSRIAGENTGNYSFYTMVDTSKSIDDQINEWANKMIELLSVCDICGEKHIILPLASYDIENFPQLKNKKVCPNCRGKFYTDKMKKMQQEWEEEDKAEDNKQKANGFNFKYSIWVHPAHGDDFETVFYASGRLSDTQIKNEITRLKRKHSANLVEQPIITEL